MFKFFLMWCLVVGSVFQAVAIEDEEFVNMTAVRQKFSLGKDAELTPEALAFATAVRDRMRINRVLLKDINSNPQQVHENMDCSYARFNDVVFLGATFRMANFSHCLFEKSVLFLTEFLESDLQQITFFKCTLLGGGFERSDLTRGRFDTVDFGSQEAKRQAIRLAVGYAMLEPALLQNARVRQLLDSITISEPTPKPQPNTQEHPKGPPAV